MRQIGELTSSLFGRNKIVEVLPLEGGLSNSNLKIRFEDHSSPYVLRLYRKDSTICRKEVELEQLVRHKVPIPRFLHADWSCERFDRAWAVVEWCDGHSLKPILDSGDSEAITSAAESLGSVLAAIHSFDFPEPGFFGEELCIGQPVAMNRDFFIRFADHQLDQTDCTELLGAEWCERVRVMCRRYADLMDERARLAKLVHSDFNGLNVLLQKRNGRFETTAVLDWEFAFAADPLTDIGNMLRYEQPDSAFERAFIGGYLQSGGELPNHWKLLSKLADLVALLDMLGRSAGTPVRAGDLIRLIKGTVIQYG